MLQGNKNGFTLLELMVTISIISLLSTIAVVAYKGVRVDARDTERTVKVKQIQASIEDFYDEFDAYPCGDGPPSPELHTGVLYSTDGSTSDEFLDGESASGTGCFIGPPDDGYPDYPIDGLYSNNYWSELVTKDPINDGVNNYRYYYIVPIDGRTEYHLSVKLEKNDELMESDGGVCDDLYEIYSNGYFNDYTADWVPGC
ncbi:type II secretion system GspH family protein [Patescibacteria group bacterium]|nr:type II secretion system GspH family protein [Patescibacteria group bacterium]